MTAPPLPDGFAVQLDRRVRRLGGTALLGGSPVRLLRLSPTARGLIEGGRVQVRDDTSARLARTLLDAGVAHPRPAGGPSRRDVTVVVPVRDNAAGLRRLLDALRGLAVVVVDDGSARPVVADGDVRVIRHDRSRGPAAARNTGLRHCRTDFVAFLDSDVLPRSGGDVLPRSGGDVSPRSGGDVLPRSGWLESLLGHFADPAVALVAPRIVALDPASDATLLDRYEAAHSALDLGERESPVAPYGTVSYVPSAAIVCRRDAIERVGGFDEALRSGEDVDLCWRLLEAGSRLRYEPIATVSHQHRRTLRQWLARRAFYGTSAAPLSRRHPDKTAPMVISAWNLAAWLLIGLGSPAGVGVAAVSAARSARRTARAMDGTDAGTGQAALLALRGVGGAGLQLCSAVCRSYWPAALALAVVSRRCRRAALAAAVIDTAHGWATRTAPPEGKAAPIGPLGYAALARLDDAGYGAGLWAGVVRERTLRPLRPVITR